jgi:hypothetical protein
MRKRRQRKQRSRRHSHKRQTRRHHRGGGLPVPSGSLVSISSKGEYGVPMLVSKEFAEAELEREGLED